MDNSKYIIKIIKFGKKMYVSNRYQSSLSIISSDHPFTDDEVIKFDLDQVMEILPQIKRYYPDKIIQVVDATGKTINTDTIGNIIKEEVVNFTAGAATPFKSKELKFADPINASFINYESFSNDYDTKVIPATKIIIHWSPVLWKNPLGIHVFNIDIEGVEGIFNLQYRDKQSDELKQETQKNIAEFPWKFNVIEATLELGKSLYVLEAEFDFKNNICTVVF